MKRLSKLAKDRLKLLLQVLPAGRDLYLVLAKDSLGISYRGLFKSSAAARAAGSSARSNDYDIVNATKARNKEREEQVLENSFETNDYALLFWLSRVLADDGKLLELGGSVGHFFYSLQRYFPCSGNVRWTIAELPEAVSLGRRITQERGEQRLSFLDSKDIASAEPVDVFMTAGTLQYMEEPLWGILASLAKLPSNVLVHNLPVHEVESHWTLQRLRLCEVPYRIYSRTELAHQMASLGYRQVAEWKNPRAIEIPFHRDMEIEGYLGFHFAREHQD